MIIRKLPFTTILLAAALGMLPANGAPPAGKATPKAKPAVVAPAARKPAVISPEDPEPAGTALTAAESEMDAEKIIARFFSYLQRKEVDQAYDQLTRGTKIAERAEDVRTLKAKTKEAIAVFGPILGYDSVSKKSVGARLVRYTLVSLGKEFPLRWRFYFYKPAGAWKLIDLRVDDKLVSMFDEAEDSRSPEAQP